MKNKTFISPDEAFNNALNSYQAEFNPAAWEHMKSLLDEDELKPVVIIPPKSNNSFKPLILFIMTLISALSIASLMVFYSAEETMKSKTDASIEAKQNPNAGSDASEFDSKPEYDGVKPEGKQHSNQLTDQYNKAYRESTFKSTGITQTITGMESDGKGTLFNPVKDTLKTVVQNGKTYKVFIRKIWVPDEYEYIEKPNGGVVKDGFIGIHFTAQQNRMSDSMSAGFNIQFMSGNRLKSQDWGAYGGIDWGMQFYGKGKKTNVVLNNTSQDSGYTRLRMHSFDVLGRAHFEYAKFPIVPYFNLMAGPRIYSTGQKVASYLELKETQSSTTHNAHTSVSMLYGFGFGARIKISRAVSLDARYEWINGSRVKLVDMENSTFNGLNYNLKYSSVTPRQEQFKIGLLFTISEREYDKKLIKEGYFKEYMVDSVEITASDSNRIIIPGPCVPCNSNTGGPYQNRPTENERPRENSTIYTPNTNSGSKGSFPGIRPPSKPIEILK